VLVLPVLVPLLGLSTVQYGIIAGLTVYAVPQVLAAAAPMGALAVQIGVLVKLVRVLMLGPLVLAMSLAVARRNAVGATEIGGPLFLHRLIPWFILGFLASSFLRSIGLVPAWLLRPAGMGATLLTLVSMAALGLGVDVRTVGQAGGRVATAVTGSLLVLVGASVVLVQLMGTR